MIAILTVFSAYVTEPLNQKSRGTYEHRRSRELFLNKQKSERSHRGQNKKCTCNIFPGINVATCVNVNLWGQSTLWRCERESLVGYLLGIILLFQCMYMIYKKGRTMPISIKLTMTEDYNCTVKLDGKLIHQSYMYADAGIFLYLVWLLLYATLNDYKSTKRHPRYENYI